MGKRTGFTLIELLIAMAIFAVTAVSFIVIFLAVVNVQTHQSSEADVAQQSQFLEQQIQYYIGSARLVDMSLDVATTTLTLRMASPSLDPTIVSVTGGTVYVQNGTGTPLAITSSHVSVTSTSFTRHYNIGSSTAYGTESVSFSFLMSENTTNTKLAYSNTLQSAASVLAPVPTIAMIQQAKAEGNSPSVSTLAATYPTNNETGSVLLALVANTTSSASVSIADSASNTWSSVASISYPAYNEELNLFKAANAKHSTNTVTATFGAGAGYASLFVYEYRNASTTAPFDVSSSQLQAGTQTPSSGSVTPSASLEMLFGATYNGSTAEVPAAGSGFTLETSSTVTHVFAEDMDQYVTGPVSAGWQYTNTTPSSSALIATFR